MTEQVTGDQTLQSASGEAQLETAPIQEKLVPQSSVEKAAKGAWHTGYEKGKREAEGALRQQMDAAAAERSGPTSLGGMAQGFHPDEVKRMIAEEVSRKTAELTEAQKKSYIDEQARLFTKDFDAKLQSGKDKFEDYDEVVMPLRKELGAFPNVAIMAHAMDNTPDVMYELGKNPLKLKALEDLALSSPYLAQQEMQKLSVSLKQNEAALSDSRSAPEPLRQVTPSVTNMGNGSYTVRDFRKRYRTTS